MTFEIPDWSESSFNYDLQNEVSGTDYNLQKVSVENPVVKKKKCSRYERKCKSLNDASKPSKQNRKPKKRNKYRHLSAAATDDKPPDDFTADVGGHADKFAAEESSPVVSAAVVRLSNDESASHLLDKTYTSNPVMPEKKCKRQAMKIDVKDPIKIGRNKIQKTKTASVPNSDPWSESQDVYEEPGDDEVDEEALKEEVSELWKKLLNSNMYNQSCQKFEESQSEEEATAFNKSSNTELGDDHKGSSKIEASQESPESVVHNTKDEKRKKKSLKERLEATLTGAKFRIINEKLYTSDSSVANKMFMESPEIFEKYHKGYRAQVEQWPLDPLHAIIKWLKKKPTNLVVADFGCGDARLAKEIPQKMVHSFDFVALSPLVTPCDMSHTPLESNSVDVVVFCLSLMGTNLKAFIVEANRVLKERGILRIAEVESRFEDVGTFIRSLEKYGFTCETNQLKNNFFRILTLQKVCPYSKSKAVPLVLKPCLYKKR